MSARIRKTLAARWRSLPTRRSSPSPRGRAASPAPSGEDGERASGGAEAEAATVMSDADAAAAARLEAAAAGGESLGLDSRSSTATLKATRRAAAERRRPALRRDRPLLPDQGAPDGAHRHARSRARCASARRLSSPRLRQTRKVKHRCRCSASPCSTRVRATASVLRGSASTKMALERGIACSAATSSPSTRSWSPCARSASSARGARRAPSSTSPWATSTVMGKATFFGRGDLEAAASTCQPNR